MKLHPWTMQVGRMCMVMLWKIGVRFHCCWMFNKCFMDLELIVWHCWLWILWWHKVVWKQKSLPQGWFVLVLIGSTPSKALDLELQFRSNVDMLLLSLVYIVWPIRQTWQYKHFQTYLWFFALKVFCNVFMLILAITLGDIWNLPYWQKSWKQKTIKNCIKIRWISMLSFVKCVLFEYHILLMKMALV